MCPSCRLARRSLPLPGRRSHPGPVCTHSPVSSPGKSGMYFVEDNAADSHDSQVRVRGSGGQVGHRGGRSSSRASHVSLQMLHGETEPASFSWTYEEIKEVHKRWWQLRDNGVEIFLTNGRTLLLAFDNTKARPVPVVLQPEVLTQTSTEHHWTV